MAGRIIVSYELYSGERMHHMPSSHVIEQPRVEIHPISDEERQQEEDAQWALHDEEILAKYVGQFVVPQQRRVVAHGYDIEAVLSEAARVTGRKPEELPVCGIVDPLLDLPH